MRTWFRWRPTKMQLLIIITILILSAFVSAIVWINGTGFGGHSSIATTTQTNPATGETTIAMTEQHQPGKTLWDWMQLLIVPAVLAAGAVYFNRSEKRNELQIAEQRAQDATLQNYLDQMTELLFEKHLRTSQPDSEVRDVARVRTLTAVRRLNADRRNIFFRFLRDAKLIKLDSDSIIDFRMADLSGADLSQTDLFINFQKANLSQTDLSRTDLSKANLTQANLRGANLHRANLRETNLREAYLTKSTLIKANLTRANLTWAYLYEANFSGAYLGEANLHQANLTKANLSGAEFVGANLTQADLTGANLNGAKLSAVNLYQAIVSQRQLATCKTLCGATLPDGTKLPNDVENPFR